MAEITLNPDNEFEAALANIVAMHRVKGEQYGSKQDPLQNFYDSAEALSESPLFACEALLQKHQSRLKKWFALPRNRRKTSDPGVDDAFLDRAVYAVIALVLYQRCDGGKDKP